MSFLLKEDGGYLLKEDGSKIPLLDVVPARTVTNGTYLSWLIGDCWRDEPLHDEPGEPPTWLGRGV